MNKLMIDDSDVGETKTGCFSDDSEDRIFVDGPMCPKCGSRDYQVYDDDHGNNCQCANCGWRYYY